jgi:hypothetical protein
LASQSRRFVSKYPSYFDSIELLLSCFLISRLLSWQEKMGQEYELTDPENDPLLDALSLLEIHGDEARDGLAEAEAGLSQLYPYFFPKKEQPAPFLALAKCFNAPENLGLRLRQESLKVCVESTIALVADSQQTFDWTKVGDTQEMARVVLSSGRSKGTAATTPPQLQQDHRVPRLHESQGEKSVKKGIVLRIPKFIFLTRFSC